MVKKLAFSYNITIESIEYMKHKKEAILFGQPLLSVV